jgi:hypothetical protein
MKKTERTTISIAIERKMELERKAIEISHKTGKQIKWTDVVHYMINNYIVNHISPFYLFSCFM